MLFGKKKKQDGMSVEMLMKFDKTPIKYVTERDSETFREKKLGENGALNVMNGEFVIVCGGINVMRCELTKVKVAELMNLSGINIVYGGESYIAYYTKGIENK